MFHLDLKFLLTIFCLGFFLSTNGQGLHFSQFNNAPLLLNPANAALQPDFDYRAGAQYRNQWSALPVPYHTFTTFADFKTVHNQEGTSWLGIGGAFYRDQAGAGDLALTNVQLSIAYHLAMGNQNMLSVGLGVAYAQRSVDYSKLTFDAQWDGFTFDPTLPQNEAYTFQKASYADISGGINYAFFPNENVYFRLGAGLAHINRPNESFYHQTNKLGMRPTVDLDAIFKLNEMWIAEVSGYYTTQQAAWELVYGAQFYCNVTPKSDWPSVLILGAYHRLGDAIIPVVGVGWNHFQITGSMDVTASALSPAVKGNGALELSLIYKGLYQNNRGKDISGYNCPRF